MVERIKRIKNLCVKNKMIDSSSSFIKIKLKEEKYLVSISKLRIHRNCLMKRNFNA